MTASTIGEDKVRYMLILNKDCHARLTALTQRHKLSQSDVIEQMLVHINVDDWAPIFDKARANKVRERAQKRTALQKLQKLEPAELERLAAQASKT